MILMDNVLEIIEKEIIGKVEQNFSFFDPTFTIYNEDDLENIKVIF